MSWMTLPEYHTFIEARGEKLNGLDKFLEVLDGIIDDFISNFYNTKVICGLAEPIDLSSVSAGFSVTLGKLQLSPTSITCLHMDIPEGVELPEGTPADGLDYYRFEFYMWDINNATVAPSSLILNNVCVFGGHIMCLVSSDGEEANIPECGLNASIHSFISGVNISENLNREVGVLPTYNSATVDISLVVQGALASVTPVNVTVDVPILSDDGGGDDNGGNNNFN